MSWVKNICDFFERHVLRTPRAQDDGEQIVDSLNSDDAPGTVTLRTYSEGGDPFEDHIEFHLTKSDTTPSGFRDPP